MLRTAELGHNQQDEIVVTLGEAGFGSAYSEFGRHPLMSTETEGTLQITLTGSNINSSF